MRVRDTLVYRDHVEAIKSGFASSIFICNQLIHLYSKHALLEDAQKLFDEIPHPNIFSWNAIIMAYIKAHNLKQARTIFDSASHRDLVSYNSILSGYVGADGYETEALDLFTRMQSARDTIGIDEFTLTTMLNLTAKLRVVCYGKQMHSYMVKTANDLSKFAVSSLIDMYSKCGLFCEACNVFSDCDVMVDLVSKNAMVAACCREQKMDMALNVFWKNPELNDTVSWNTLIAGYAQNGYMEKSLTLFVEMIENGIGCNEHTLASVLSACSGLKCLKLGKCVHAWGLKNGYSSNQFISSGIVDFYCKCGNIRYAKSVYDGIGIKSPFAAASLIAGYSSQGNMTEAQRLFDSLSERNSVVWTALCSGYVKSQQCEAVFKLFREYRTTEALVPDAMIIISVLGACAIQAALSLGKQIHAYILRVRLNMDEKLLSAFVDMYSKCGNITYAEKIFQLVTDSDRDAVLYNVMIAGYAHHGFENKAIQLFQEMLKKSVKPDAVTFVALLSACRHRGLVELGEQFFISMEEDYNVFPEIYHYACMVDMYGKANQLEKAVEFMRKIPIQIDATIWGAFLNACQTSSNTALVKQAEEKLLKAEADNGSRYVQLANVYAAEGKWDEMGRMRKKMRVKEAKKLAGCSWIYVENGNHVFTSGDTSHSKADAIYSTLVGLNGELYLSFPELKQLYEIGGDVVEDIF
ncbi:putative pentatricopeptide repeat-containing protein At3g18840 [Gastrolobium bilobum]|uniref:putative pentatricopeptide repeat-containing protein At3g18840 n=1 Tax=Gastrolobium bilobum TaxID=150636 RepID=UPI002AB05A64|nr:putative pentatricopeptide repeat-containing protein At3g18840 [Gastrolobium bilobum]